MISVQKLWFRQINTQTPTDNDFWFVYLYYCLCYRVAIACIWQLNDFYHKVKQIFDETCAEWSNAIHWLWQWILLWCLNGNKRMYRVLRFLWSLRWSALICSYTYDLWKKKSNNCSSNHLIVMYFMTLIVLHRTYFKAKVSDFLSTLIFPHTYKWIIYRSDWILAMIWISSHMYLLDW